MNSQHRYAIAVSFAAYLFVAGPVWAQEAAAPPHGFPQDWSDRSIAFSLDALAQHPDLIEKEPRIRRQIMQRFRAPEPTALLGTAIGAETLGEVVHHRDWNLALGRGHVAANMYPGKYTFNPAATPSCSSDFVVFGLDIAGATGGQANLVALNNLYAGTGGICTTGPTVYFAYNITTGTGGKIVTSPIISEDGTKIAFVESLGSSSVFHVLTFTAGQGGITTAAAPTGMVSLTYSTTDTTTTSSPWIDYGGDIVYVSDDGGVLHKVTGVFKGTPTLVTTAPWPITVSAGTRLSPPVLDQFSGVLFVGGRNGDLYEVNATSGIISALEVGLHGGTNAGIFAPPIVDGSNGVAYVVSADGNNGSGTSAILQEISTTTLTALATAPIGLGASGGDTTETIYQPALSNAYYTSPSSGAIYTCGTGTADTTPWEYSFGFNGLLMKTAPSASEQLLTSTAARCTSWSEFFNPNIGGAGGTDFFFFGLTQDCTGTGTSGCVAERTTATQTLTTVDIAGGPSGIIVDNYSTAGQASSIYFTGEKTNTAYKFTQNGLQ